MAAAYMEGLSQMKETKQKPRELWGIYAHGICLGKFYMNRRAAHTYAAPGEMIVHFREVLDEPHRGRVSE